MAAVDSTLCAQSRTTNSPSMCAHNNPQKTSLKWFSIWEGLISQCFHILKIFFLVHTNSSQVILPNVGLEHNEVKSFILLNSAHTFTANVNSDTDYGGIFIKTNYWLIIICKHVSFNMFSEHSQNFTFVAFFQICILLCFLRFAAHGLYVCDICLIPVIWDL